MKKSFIFSSFILCFIAGIAFDSLLRFDFFYYFLFLCLSLVFFFISWLGKNQKNKIIALGGVFLFLGLGRSNLSMPRIGPDHVAYYHGKNLIFDGQVVSEPDIRFDQTKLTMGNIKITGLPVGKTNVLSLRGAILVSVPNYPAYHYGDWLEITCQLQKPEKIEDFDYGRYLSVRGIYAVCYEAMRIEHLPLGRLTLWQKIRRSILSFKTRFEDIIASSIVYPESEILSGLTLGVRRGIPENVSLAFSRVGLTHILAVSGMNITLIAGLFMNFFLVLGLYRRHAFYAAITGLFLFLVMLGWQSSAVRAGVMGFFMLLSMKVGRLYRSCNALLLTACLLLIFNPLLLIYDVGFQLSFLAVLGIIYLGGPLEKMLSYLKVPEFLEIRSSLVMTFAAQFLVLPLLLYYFGNLSLIAPLANILILPLIPFLTVGGFIMVFLGLIYLPLAYLLGLVLRLGLSWILFITEKFSALPGATYQLKKVDFAWILISYMFLGWGIWTLKFKNKKSRPLV